MVSTDSLWLKQMIIAQCDEIVSIHSIWLKQMLIVNQETLYALCEGTVSVNSILLKQALIVDKLEYLFSRYSSVGWSLYWPWIGADD